jgi:hypothetical protein
MWTHRMLYGMSDKVEYKPNAGGRNSARNFRAAVK